MINDLLTSSKGPGFIGLILALIVLMGFGSLAFFVLEDDSGGKGVNGQIKDKERHLGKLKFAEEKWVVTIKDYTDKQKIAVERSKIERQVKRKQALVETGKIKLAGVEAKVAQAHKNIEDYKDRYRIYERGRAVGEKIDHLEIKNGKKYEQVVIRRVFNEGMDIRHKNGGTLIEYQFLPDDFLDRFQFSAKDKEAVNRLKGRQQQEAVRVGISAAKSTKVRDFRNKINTSKYELSRTIRAIANAEVSIKSKNAAAERADRKASEHRSKAASARAAGRYSMQGALATRENAKAVACRKSVAKLGSLLRVKQAEAAKTRSSIGALENTLKSLLSTNK